MRDVIAILVVVVALSASDERAEAQGSNLLGTWDCGNSVVSHQYRSRTAMAFRLILRPNGSFSARGVHNIVGHTHQGSGRTQFVAQGRWRLQRGSIGLALFLTGTQVAQTGARQNFSFGTVVRAPHYMVYQTRNAAYTQSSSCKRPQ